MFFLCTSCISFSDDLLSSEVLAAMEELLIWRGTVSEMELLDFGGGGDKEESEALIKFLDFASW